MRKIILFILFFFSINIYSQYLYTKYPVTNGAVYSIDKDNDYTYFGGSFNYVGYNTGSFSKLTTSNINPDLNFPFFNGIVHSVLSDDNGVYYVAGTFTLVNNQVYKYFVHILNNGTIDPTFNLNLDKAVYTIVKD
jgi:hypothetical protein